MAEVLSTLCWHHDRQQKARIRVCSERSSCRTVVNCLNLLWSQGNEYLIRGWLNYVVYCLSKVMPLWWGCKRDTYHIVRGWLSLQWHHMSAMEIQILTNSTVCLTACPVRQQRKRRSTVALVICKDNSLVTGGFPSQRVMLKDSMSCHA